MSLQNQRACFTLHRWHVRKPNSAWKGLAPQTIPLRHNVQLRERTHGVFSMEAPWACLMGLTGWKTPEEGKDTWFRMSSALQLCSWEVTHDEYFQKPTRPGIHSKSGEENSPPRGPLPLAFCYHSNPLQCSRLENPPDGGAWRATAHGVTKSRTRLSD